MINLSQVAIKEIKRLQSKQQQKTVVILTVEPGGCSGLIYDLSFMVVDGEDNNTLKVSSLESIDSSAKSHLNHGNDSTVATQTEIFAGNGIKIITDSDTCHYIQNLTIDYSEDLMGGGFRFNNPQATATCECGNSFSVTATS
jgi:Fe-S cluster assembly iron-binding protein IscA